MDGLIFVNSANIDFKRLNRLFVYLNDWDYGDDNDFFKLVTTKDAHELDENEGTRLMSIEPVHADLDADPANAWQGSSLADIEKHILGLGGTLYLLLDDKGALDHTVIIGERRWDDETEGLTDDFDRVRCPWDCAYSMWANLDIANMNFDEFINDEKGKDEDGWYEYTEDLPADISEESQRRRAEKLAKLEREGKA